MSLFKTIDKKIDTDQIREEGASLVETVAEQAGRAAEWLSPRVDRARDEAARYAKDAQARLEPTYEEYRARVTEDYYPRAQRAAVAAQAAAKTPGTVTERAQRAAVAAKKAAVDLPSPRKQHRFLKCLGWLTVAGAAAGGAYVVWRRSQPVEDPWAEEYWADSTADASSTPSTVDSLKAKAADAAELAQVKASEVKDKAAEVAGQAKDKAAEVADQAKAKVAEKKDDEEAPFPAEPEV